MTIHVSFIHKSQILQKCKCLSTGECINRLPHVRKEDCCSELRTVLLIHLAGLMNLKSRMLSKRNQTQKLTYFMLRLIGNSGRSNTTVTDQWLPRLRMGRGTDGNHEGNFSGDVNTLYLIMIVDTGPNILGKAHQVINLKWWILLYVN